MKKRIQTFYFFTSVLAIMVFGFNSNAQSPCSVDLHQVFGYSSKETPVVLNRLGTSPQFGEIPKHSAQAAYSHLKSVHKKNLRNSRSEIDSYFRALGYTGFLDPTFSAKQITAEILPKGKVGWMGAYSKGHKYKWSVLGNDFESFRIASKDGSCFAYIMKKCGNAFYDPTEREAAEAAALAFNNKPKITCATQTINFSGNGKIMASDVINTKEKFSVEANYNGKNLCLGDYEVPVRLTYDMTASGDINYAKTVKLCDYGQGVPASSNINVPINLLYSLAASNVNIGENGKMIMTINSKQYKALKKVYKACPADQTNAPTTNTLSAVKNQTVSEKSESTISGGGDGTNCTKQTINLNGNAVTEDVSNKTGTNEVTLIGYYKKDGKLQKGETANKYMCLGSYNVPAKSSLQYSLKGNSNLSHIVEVCDDGSVKPVDEISVPFNMTNNFTKQDVMVGDYGKVYMPLTKSQYKKLGKVFKRCCSDGSTKNKCY